MRIRMRCCIVVSWWGRWSLLQCWLSSSLNYCLDPPLLPSLLWCSESHADETQRIFLFISCSIMEREKEPRGPDRKSFSWDVKCEGKRWLCWFWIGGSCGWYQLYYHFFPFRFSFFMPLITWIMPLSYLLKNAVKLFLFFMHVSESSKWK